MNIYFIRHGDDDERYRGGWSELPLVEEGIRKAKLLGKYLKENESEYNFEKIISSDLTRTKMTTEYINKELNLPIVYDSRIRENNNGELAGMLNEEAVKKYPNAFFGTLGYNEKFPGGESPHQFYNRIKKAFFSIIEENKDVENLAIVTHAGVIAIIYHVVNKMRWTNKKKSLSIPKTSISKLVENGKDMVFEYLSQTPHLNNK